MCKTTTYCITMLRKSEQVCYCHWWCDVEQHVHTYVCIYGISAVLTKGRKRKWTIVINLLLYDNFIFSCKFSTVSFCQALWEFFRKRGQLEKYWYNKIGALSLLSHFHNSTVYWFCIAKFCANPACPKRMIWGLFQDISRCRVSGQFY